MNPAPRTTFLKFTDPAGKVFTAEDNGATFHGEPVLALSGGGFASVPHIMSGNNRIIESVVDGKREVATP